MARKNMPTFEDWEAEKMKDPDFLAAAGELEPGYQIARLRMLRGLIRVLIAMRSLSEKHSG